MKLGFESQGGGGTHVRTHGRMNESPPVFYRNSSPARLLPCFLSLQLTIMQSRPWQRLSLTTYCPWATCSFVCLFICLLVSPLATQVSNQASQTSYQVFQASNQPFWAAAPKGAMSCRTQGDFRLFVHSSVRACVPPPSLETQIPASRLKSKP